ncbi:MAG: hypothetical protein ACO3N7_02320, partial [Kiritimatiellia bacterium]
MITITIEIGRLHQFRETPRPSIPVSFLFICAELRFIEDHVHFQTRHKDLFMFESIVPAPPDAISGLTDDFKAVPNPDKINLGVGVYKDAAG